MRWPFDVAEIARQTLLLLLRGRVVRWLAIAALAAAALLGAVARRAAGEGIGGEEFVGIATYLMVFMFGLPVSALFLGVTVVHGDLEDRTASFLFARPLRRSALLIGKLLAAIAVAWLLAATAIIAIYVSVAIAAPEWRLGLQPRSDTAVAFVQGAFLACIAYAVMGGLLGAWMRRPLVSAGVFFVGWEFIASIVPPEAGVRSMTVAGPVRRWLWQRIDPDRGSELNDLLAAGLDRFDGLDALVAPTTALLRFVLVVLLAGLWIYGRREYDARARD